LIYLKSGVISYTKYAQFLSFVSINSKLETCNYIDITQNLWCSMVICLFLPL